MPTVMKLPDESDNLITLPIDLKDGGPLITVTCPTTNWMPPEHTKAYKDWIASVSKMAAEYDEWQAKVEAYDAAVAAGTVPKPRKPGKAPHDPADIPTSTRAFQLRWLKPYVSDDDFKRLNDENVQEGLVTAIYEALLGAGEEAEISEGESSASADS